LETFVFRQETVWWSETRAYPICYAFGMGLSGNKCPFPPAFMTRLEWRRTENTERHVILIDETGEQRHKSKTKFVLTNR